MEPVKKEKKLLVLDLDETLIFADLKPLSFRQCDFQNQEYFVYERPGVRAFLTFALANFEVAVWTSSTADYALPIVDFLFPKPAKLAFVWCRERCTLKYSFDLMEHFHIKPFRKLKKLGFRLEQVLAVDDSPSKHIKNYGNLIRIREYLGEPEDRELGFLQAYLETLKDAPNVRSIEKRWWRNEIVVNETNPNP